MSTREPISEETRIKLFQWCSRHCCFCGKECATSIEIHHIDGDHSNNQEDNLIPVCFDCHAHLGHYNPDHPRGNKYREEEIKARREQIYDKHTLPYVRHVDIQISRRLPDGNFRDWGDTSCTVRSNSTDLPIQMRLEISIYEGESKLDINIGDIYMGKGIWNLNPGTIVFGHFTFSAKEDLDPFEYRVQLQWSIVDMLNREHPMLPTSFVWNDLEGDWWYDPRALYE